MLNGKSGLLLSISPQKRQEISEREKKIFFACCFSSLSFALLPFLCQVKREKMERNICLPCEEEEEEEMLFIPSPL